MKIVLNEGDKLLETLNKLINNETFFQEETTINLSGIKNTAIFSVTIDKNGNGWHISIFFKNNRPSVKYIFENKKDLGGLVFYIIDLINRYTFINNSKLWYNNFKFKDKGKEGFFDNIIINKNELEIILNKTGHFKEIYDQKRHNFINYFKTELDTIFFNWNKNIIIYKGYRIKYDRYTENKIENKELYEKYNINDLIYDSTLYFIYELKKDDVTLLVHIFMEEGADNKGEFLKITTKIKEII